MSALSTFTRTASTALLACLLSTSVNAAPVQWASSAGGNDNWYEWISGTYTWSAANAAAQSTTFGTATGHLATVTSTAENNFLLSLSNDGWLGGTDVGTEGIWKWVGGAEAGVTFWVGGTGGYSPTYASWPSWEPNNLGNEDYLHLGGGNWNDLPNNNYGIGYFVEFESVPAPGALMLLGLGLLGLGARRKSQR